MSEVKLTPAQKNLLERINGGMHIAQVRRARLHRSANSLIAKGLAGWRHLREGEVLMPSEAGLRVLAALRARGEASHEG